LMDHSPIVVRRVYLRLEAEAHPYAPKPYDFPLPTPWRDPIRREVRPIPTQTAEWGRSDITTVAWIAPANQPVWPARPRQQQLARAQNVLPITAAAAPANSWGPSAEIPVRRLRFFGLWQSLAQEVTPITSTVTLVSSWINLPPMPRRRSGLPAPEQQTYAGPPPAVEVIIQDAPWRPLLPDWLRRPRWLWTLLHLPGPPNQRTVASGIGCIMVDQPGLTEPLLLAPHVEASTLIDPTLTASSLEGPELC
ncbi:MAG TPA: hypothetical protein VFE84_12615, partial [Patescibacteria group bacterium]|nr:hypothetical protein [Patescibacteria group bacterium]